MPCTDALFKGPFDQFSQRGRAVQRRVVVARPGTQLDHGYVNELDSGGDGQGLGG